MSWLADNIQKYFPENTRRFSVAYKWFLLAFLVFALYYLLIIVVLPVVRYDFIIPAEKPGRSKTLKHDFSSYYSVDDSIRKRSVLLANKEAFLLASLEMARNNMISLEVNLPDSTVSLVIQGLRIHTASVTGFRYSKILSKSDPFLTAELFSYPFKIKEYISSVPKIPVIIRKAPKDTIEAASLPEPSHLEENHQYVSFKFMLDRKLNLVFEQDSISDAISRKTIRQYNRQERKIKRRLIKYAFIRAGAYEYIPEIRIRLDRNDALVLFRAIPENADVTVRLNPL